MVFDEVVTVLGSSIKESDWKAYICAHGEIVRARPTALWRDSTFLLQASTESHIRFQNPTI